jgi:hypothetical protein
MLFDWLVTGQVIPHNPATPDSLDTDILAMRDLAIPRTIPVPLSQQNLNAAAQAAYNLERSRDYCDWPGWR